jgi:hypothetical protein
MAALFKSPKMESASHAAGRPEKIMAVAHFPPSSILLPRLQNNTKNILPV